MARNVFELGPLVGAIEFGTESLKVALAFAHDPWTIHGHIWSDSEGYLTAENITCILLGPDGKTFDSFGYDAETKYKELVEDENQTSYYFFKGFGGLDKVEEQCGTTITIQDESGKTLDAVDVFAIMIEHVQSQLIAKLDVKVWEVSWVLVLPAGTSPLFFKLMSDSAKKTGTDDKKCLIISATDAAAQLFANSNTSKWIKPSKDTQFLTVIAGDEHLDTVVYKIEADGKIIQISSLKRGIWGIAMVCRKFEDLLTDIVGQSVLETFKSEAREDWIELIRIFKHRIVKSYLSDYCTIALPSSLLETLKIRTGKTMKDAIDDSNYAEVSKQIGEKFRISTTFFKQMFSETLKKISLQIKTVMQFMDVEAIFMTGKFADAEVFRESMTSDFGESFVVFPEDCSNAVLRGAFTAALKNHKFKHYVGPKTPLVVASIDIGTTYSGWARSYRFDFEENPTKSFVRYWYSDSATTEKTPTHVLMRNDGKTAEAFGYEAINLYRQLIENEERQDVYYFRNFKMSLFKKFGEKLDRNIVIEDEVGRSLPALNVIAASIKYLKDDFLQQCDNELVGSLSEDEVQWVLTVPAIWSDGAKQFMREAAIMAGIKSRRLMLALEPEAASIYCRYLPVESRDDGRGSSVSTFQSGTKYMILDAGGGTVDITVHEVIDKKSVKEVHAASGGGWGGMMVNYAFEKLIEGLTGDDVYTAFCEEETNDHLELLESFEIKKRTVSPTNNTLVRMNIPLSLIQMYTSIKGSSLEKDILNSRYSDSVKLQRNKITFTAEIIRSLFKEPIDNILHHISNLLKDTEVLAILMVGGFSDSPMLRSAVKERFPDTEVVVPREAITSVLKGAVIFGHLPRQITERVLKYTYGVRVHRPFINGKHPESKRVPSDKGDRCKDLFDKHVQRNKSVTVGEPQTENSYTPLNKSQTSASIEVFASELDDPEFTDQNCTYVGKLTVDLTEHDGDLNRAVKVAMTFSDTEIVVEARDEKTGDQTSVAIDFLG